MLLLLWLISVVTHFNTQTGCTLFSLRKPCRMTHPIQMCKKLLQLQLQLSSITADVIKLCRLELIVPLQYFFTYIFIVIFISNLVQDFDLRDEQEKQSSHAGHQHLFPFIACCKCQLFLCLDYSFKLSLWDASELGKLSFSDAPGMIMGWER